MSKPLRSKSKILVLILMLGMSPSVFGTYFFWTGSVSSDVTDANNWESELAQPTLPTGSDVALVGIDSDWGEVIPTNQPVLTTEWVNSNGDPNAGWWIINGVGNQNSLTVGDGAYILFTKNDCNLRNGGTIHVIGRNSDDGPSIVIPPRFRIGYSGDTPENYPDATGTILIEDDGYLRFDPSVAVKGSGGSQIYMGDLVNALIEIRDDGILETVDGTHLDDTDIVTPQFVFASDDPSVNKIVIYGNGQLILSGDPVTGLVEEEETSLEEMIAMGLITSGEDGIELEIVGSEPTIVKNKGMRVSDPQPEDGASDTDKDIVLSWEASVVALEYDIYFGTDQDRVSTATRDNPLDVLVSLGQQDVLYPTDDVLSLERDQTYYWRVDEITDTEGQKNQTGDVWSFSVEPYGIPISDQDIVATSSSQYKDQGPEKTIDLSGLDANSLHSTSSAEMWLSGTEDPNSAWIQYDFDKPYKLHQMRVWNFNGQQFLTGLGLKEVTIEYALNGSDLQTLGTFEFAEAPGSDDYAPNTTVSFDGITATSIKITAITNHNTLFSQYGLSEVQFLYVPLSAREPVPATDTNEVEVDSVLSWRAGREAAEHTVYISTDEQAVSDRTATSGTVSLAEYSPTLELDTTYYWCVDEVNDAEDPSLWSGSTWSFTTLDTIVLDDFESYTNDSPNRVFQVWLDGVGYTADDYYPDDYSGNGTGSMIGHNIWSGGYDDIMELNVTHGGEQSMPMYYDNSDEDTSQTDRSFSPAEDWTQYGITTLTIHFYGPADNSGQLYVKIGNTKISYPGDTTDIAAEEWISWEIDLGTSDASPLANVSTLSIGIEGDDAEGVLYIDDVLLK